MYQSRSEEIFEKYLQLLDVHLQQVLDGNVDEMLELHEIAERLFIHTTHLSNVIKNLTGKHPCYFYDVRFWKQPKVYWATSKTPSLMLRVYLHTILSILQNGSRCMPV